MVFGFGDKGITIRDAHFPGRPGIDSYGNGGFRFADMSHRGSLLFFRPAYTAGSRRRRRRSPGRPSNGCLPRPASSS